MKKRLLIVGVAAMGVVALAAGGVAWGQGTGSEAGDDRDRQVTGALAERAEAAVLESLGSGHVTGVERDSDNAYEVEVRRADGSTVDVDLDASFEVVQDGDRGENDRDDADEADDRDDRDRDDGSNERDDNSDDGPNERDDEPNDD